LIHARVTARIGENTIREWVQTLWPGSSVLDLGCGCGVPVAEPYWRMAAESTRWTPPPQWSRRFNSGFLRSQVQCADVTVAEPDSFGLRFDAAVAWGLLFLLTREQQIHLIAQVAHALRPGGRFLFTSPAQACEWNDVLTGGKSVPLGRSTYAQILKTEGFTLEAETVDEGDNPYYWAIRQT
jgi:SAM-dependent methyltransferase